MDRRNFHLAATITVLGLVLAVALKPFCDRAATIKDYVHSNVFIIVAALVSLFIIVVHHWMNRNLTEDMTYLGTDIDYETQSVPYDADPVERISKLLKYNKALVTQSFASVATMDDVLHRGKKVSKNGNCLGQVIMNNNIQLSMVTWMNYETVLCRVKHFADGLVKLGIKPASQSCVGIYSANCSQYVIAEYGCYRHTMIVVPVYDTLGANIASFIANQTELSTIICDRASRVETILGQAKEFKTLKNIILMNAEQTTNVLREQAKSNGFTLYSMAEVEQMGNDNPIPDEHKPKVNDLAIICYTSGTTSTPKGVMLTHQNVIASVSTIHTHLMDQRPSPDDVMISILPLAHMFQRIGETCMFIEGGQLVYYSGDIQQLASEIRVARPTIMLVVPRLLNRIYDSIQSRVRGNLFKKLLLNWTYKAKQSDCEQHIIRRDTLWDRLVFNRIREHFGSRLRLICVGSAPLSPTVLDFLRCALGCVISEGYGQTECVGPCTATVMGDFTTGHIGPPLVGARVKLEDFVEMGYYAKEGKGEILVKGPVVFQGYYKMPEKTAETLDTDGWLHTGDIGEWTEEGTLKLIDRKKNIFKLSQGEYIAPEKIENVLLNCRYVSQVFIYGQSLKSSLVAIVVPNFDNMKQSPKFRSVTQDSESLNTPIVKRTILEDLERIGRREGLKSFELPKNVYFQLAPFSIENGLLTPSLKSKRNVIIKRFESEIEQLYIELENAKTTI